VGPLSVQWKDGSITWVALKDMKNSYPFQMAEFSMLNRISVEPAFAWWVSHVLKKRNRIIAKILSQSVGFEPTSLASASPSLLSRRQKKQMSRMGTRIGRTLFARR
jgi:hypothetical protein